MPKHAYGFEGTHIPILALASTPMVAQVQLWQFVADLGNRDRGQVDPRMTFAQHGVPSRAPSQHRTPEDGVRARKKGSLWRASAS